MGVEDVENFIKREYSGNFEYTVRKIEASQFSGIFEIWVKAETK